MADQKQPVELQSVLPAETRKGVYANVVNIHVTNTECVINFVFQNQADTPKGTVVSRVIIPRKLATELPDIFKNVISIANEKDNNG